MYTHRKHSANHSAHLDEMYGTADRQMDHHMSLTKRSSQMLSAESGSSWNGTASMIFADPPSV